MMEPATGKRMVGAGAAQQQARRKWVFETDLFGIDHGAMLPVKKPARGDLRIA
jgi:hypothetical protein